MLNWVRSGTDAKWAFYESRFPDFKRPQHESNTLFRWKLVEINISQFLKNCLGCKQWRCFDHIFAVTNAQPPTSRSKLESFYKILNENAI